MKKKYVHYLNSTNKTVLLQGVGKTGPYLGQDGPSPFFLPHIFPGLMTAVYVVAYSVE